MIMQLADGSIAVFLDANFRPVAEEKAVWVKVIHEDGRIQFGRVS